MGYLPYYSLSNNVLKKLKKDNLLKEIHVMVVSNLGQDTDKKKTKKLGASDYLIKSEVPVDELVKIVLAKLK